VQLEEEGLETVVRIDRPARLGERLLLACVHTDVRSGMFRLEEAYRAPLLQGTGETDTQLAFLGEPGEGEEEDGVADAQVSLDPREDRLVTLA
jgi:hypothetical protein